MTTSLNSNPITQFQVWFDQAALEHPLQNFHAMTLSTLGEDGFPDARIVLLKGVDQRGFVFFTNRNSIKGKQLALTPKAALTFYWPTLGYQVRVQGMVEATSDDESDLYFASRVRGSQIGAWASAQSEVLSSQDVFESAIEAIETRFAGQPVPRPNFWGGYRVIPHKIEFWIEGDYRLHERFEYTKSSDASGEWCRCQRFP